MKNHFQQSLLLACMGTLSAGLLISAPAAHADCSSKQGAAYTYCMEQEKKSEDAARDRRWEERKKLDQGIQDTRPQPGDGSGLGVDILGMLFTSLFTSPSIISSDGNIGFGSQVRVPITKQVGLRGGISFQKNEVPVNIGVTYSVIGDGMIQPFIGGGYRTSTSKGFSMYGSAGVDVPLFGGVGITTQANQGFLGGSFSEFQAAINFFGF
jgi:hypothetical protein